MILYSKNRSYPAEIPNKIRLTDGRTRTDRATFTDEEIEDAGYIRVEAPPNYEYPNILEWDGYNLQWVIRPPNDQETLQRWEEIKLICGKLLYDTDYKVIKAVEKTYVNGTSIEQELDSRYVMYRQSIRDIYNNVNSIDPWNIQWPDPPL